MLKIAFPRFSHWNDEQTLQQAILVAKNQPIDLEEIKKWAKDEGHQEKMKRFLKELERDVKKG